MAQRPDASAVDSAYAARMQAPSSMLPASALNGIDPGSPPVAAAHGHDFRWLHEADAAYAAMEQLVATSRTTLDLEFYIFTRGEVTRRLVEAMAQAARRGVRVRVLLDAYGSGGQGDAWLEPLATAGVELRWFNPRRLLRYTCRDHRKLVVADGSQAIVGGFNVADEYAGDGITSGWRDLGLWLEGPVAGSLHASFTRLFEAAAMGRRDWLRLLRAVRHSHVSSGDVQLLLSGPGRPHSHMRSALYADLGHAARIDIMAGYFIPNGRIRRVLRRRARSDSVRVLAAGVTDVPLAQLASRSLYPMLLRAGARVYEYQPQVLHAKALLVDDVVYVGSANLDARSLQLNFELMLRIRDPELAAQLRARFEADLAHATPVQPAWVAQWGLARRLLQWLARQVVSRLDRWIALGALRRLL
jgi:cardiolipin synthase